MTVRWTFQFASSRLCTCIHGAFNIFILMISFPIFQGQEKVELHQFSIDGIIYGGRNYRSITQLKNLTKSSPNPHHPHVPSQTVMDCMKKFSATKTLRYLTSLGHLERASSFSMERALQKYRVQQTVRTCIGFMKRNKKVHRSQSLCTIETADCPQGGVPSLMI